MPSGWNLGSEIFLGSCHLAISSGVGSEWGSADALIEDVFKQKSETALINSIFLDKMCPPYLLMN